jgi:hypothetical protein
MDTKCINRNAGVNKVIPVSVILLCWLIFSSGSELRAQESVDLPSKPEATAATIAQDNSTLSGSTDAGNIDAAVISPQPLSFSDRVKIYERSFVHPRL